MSQGLKVLEARKIELDGKPAWKFACPGCKVMGRADEDQAKGEVSCVCPKCGWHENVVLHDDLDYFQSFKAKRKARAKSSLPPPRKR
jgi:predicted RNA-binding Zn-ribbon protein involved in translation (DUF1610 family)